MSLAFPSDAELELAAKGRACTFNGPECRHGDTSTTVLCHVRRWGAGALAEKPPGLVAFWGCAPCHDLFDGRVRIRGFGADVLDLYAFRAMIRTLCELTKGD